MEQPRDSLSCHSQKLELISNSLLIEGTCSMGYAAASSTPQPSRTPWSAQSGQAEGPGSLAMGDAEEMSRPQRLLPLSLPAEFL